MTRFIINAYKYEVRLLNVPFELYTKLSTHINFTHNHTHIKNNKKWVVWEAALTVIIPFHMKPPEKL